MTPDPHNNQNKENAATTNQHPLTPAQRRFVEATHRALKKVLARKFAKANLYGQQIDDIAQFAIEKVIKQVDKFMSRHQSPEHAANAIAKNAFIDSVRREWAQRGHGARGTRVVVGDKPLDRNDPNGPGLIDAYAGDVVDPESWIEREHQIDLIERLQGLMTTLAFEGFVLTAIHELSQEQAAVQLGVSREHLNREMGKAQRFIKQYTSNWEIK